MAKKKNKSKANKLKNAKSAVLKINNDLINASFDVIENSVKTGEKWQKLTAKLIKKSEPLTKNQIDLFVDTAENLKQQADFGLLRLKKLVGYNAKTKKKTKDVSLVKKAEKMVSKLKKEVSKNPIVKTADKISSKIRKEAVDTLKGNKRSVVKKEIKVVKKTPTIKASKVKNDLKVIKGIGPKMEALLNKNKIISFEQLAKMTIKDLRTVLINEGVNTKLYNPSDWKTQAKNLIKK